MMQDFVFPADPAIARRLVGLAAVTTTQITPEIEQLARTGLMSPKSFAAFPGLSEAQRAAIQRLIDYRLRGVVLADSDDSARETILISALIQGVRPIIVCTRSPRPWKTLAETHRLVVGANPLESPDMLLVDSSTILSKDVIDARRDGLLVIEHTERADYGAAQNDQAVVREFAQTIVISNFGSLTRTFHSWTRQCDLALKISLEYLWDSGVLGILDQTPKVVTDLKKRGFKKFRAADLYFMFNVVPDLLGDRGPR